jgi:hypothetical protein
MLIAFEIPICMEVWGPKPSNIENLNVAFKYGKQLCSLVFYGESVNEIEGDTKLYSRNIDKIIFQVTDIDAHLETRVQKKNWVEVEAAIRKIANRLIKALRNHGKVVFLHELTTPANKYEAEIRIRQWKVRVGNNVDGLNELLPNFGLLGELSSNSFLAQFPAQQFPALYIYNWLNVLESLKSTDSPFLPEENEFTVNALENLRLKNYRLAVMEMIIALEIVLDKFLRIYLKDFKEVPSKRINKFLSPQLGLTAKVAAILNITLEEYEIADIDFDIVLKVIEWRNNIVHEVGNKLPIEDHQRIEDALTKVQLLIHRIRFKIDILRDCLEFKKIGASISEKYVLPEPKIIRTMTYSVSVRFIIIEDSHSMLEKDKVVEVVNDLKDMFARYDCRLEDYLDLKIGFIGYPSRRYLNYKDNNCEEGYYSKVYFEQDSHNEGNFRLRIVK